MALIDSCLIQPLSKLQRTKLSDKNGIAQNVYFTILFEMQMLQNIFLICSQVMFDICEDCLSLPSIASVLIKDNLCVIHTIIDKPNPFIKKK